ncbi:hypothetical protein CC86DRAFT_375255 [Ophiobolus disseminans]|uniref:Uncharacterized protein n=1 Tax=Ophiobolus disseminans TaxID=1469910 RepID=A0A6A6ZEL2_9PLEO|nr:hypothetical protein CC86DRAFT_375255 [Ophiobolus disseminans]
MCVQRDYVSALAGGVAKEMKHTSFVSKHAYVLRLFELVSPVIADDAEDTEESGPPLRVYCPVEGAECYTTLDAAHRAAKHLQIELSHEKIPKGATETKWQKTEVQQLNDFVRNLREVKDGEERFWESEFNGTGLGSKKFQLVVEKVNMCGPRNL